jgi:hypothetical protein
MPFVTEKKNLSSEPAANWNRVEVFAKQASFGSSFGSFDEGEQSGEFKGRSSASQEDPESRGSLVSQSSTGSARERRSSALSGSIRHFAGSVKTGSLLQLLKHSERPSDLHDVHDVEYNEVRNRRHAVSPPLSCIGNIAS